MDDIPNTDPKPPPLPPMLEALRSIEEIMWELENRLRDEENEDGQHPR